MSSKIIRWHVIDRSCRDFILEQSVDIMPPMIEAGHITTYLVDLGQIHFGHNQFLTVFGIGFTEDLPPGIDDLKKWQ